MKKHSTVIAASAVLVALAIPTSAFAAESPVASPQPGVVDTGFTAGVSAPTVKAQYQTGGYAVIDVTSFAGARVTIVDGSGRLVAEGVADTDGAFRAYAEKPGGGKAKYIATVRDDAGHVSPRAVASVSFPVKAVAPARVSGEYRDGSGQLHIKGLPGATVQVVEGDGTPVYQGQLNANGRLDLFVGHPEGGRVKYSVTVVEGADRVSAAATAAITFPAEIPSPRA